MVSGRLFIRKNGDLFGFNLVSHGSKAQLAPPAEKKQGFQMAVLTPKSDIDKIIICAHQQY